jgi:hypothetical protein
MSASRESAFRNEEVELFRARQAASVSCASTDDCDQAWARTQAFIKTHSASRIIRADGTVVETALPHSFGFVYLAASKTRTDEGGTVIRLKAMCRGMYDSAGNAGVLYTSCAKSIVAVEAEFHEWLAPAK